jgi:hypothetical protein
LFWKPSGNLSLVKWLWVRSTSCMRFNF